MRIAETVTFGGSGLDRAAAARADPAALARLLADSAARVLPVWRGKPGMAAGALGWLPAGHAVVAGAEALLLGVDDEGDGEGGGPRFAADVSAWAPPDIAPTFGAFLDPSEQRDPRSPEGHAYAELRGAMARLTAREAELAAIARGLTGWHASHRFCARCGSPSAIDMGGWRRLCGACGAHHFPRTDPVVIMLILSGDRVLLGRSPGWPEGMFSLLAGFVEPGETVEGAVRREVMEEAGVRVGRVDYLASQPWPFPASLMIGCRGEALTEAIEIDPAEIEAARWAGREEMAAAFAGAHPEIRPPRAGAIAGFLLRAWLADALG